jgi:hypothetical protein
MDETLRTMTLQGNLGEGILVNVMQYLAMNQSTGCLLVRHFQGEQGQLYVEEGFVVHVCLGAQLDVRATATLLEWREGTYHFRADLPLIKTMRSSLERLLLEAVMYADVSRKYGYNPFYEDSILTAKELQKDQIVSLSLRAVRLLPHLGGLHTLGEIAEETQIPLNDVLAAAKELHEQGLTDNRAITISSAFVDNLKTLVVNIVGPMGEIIVEDALYDLGVSEEALPMRMIPALLRTLESEIDNRQWREQFGQGVRQLCDQYGVSVSV